MLLVILAQVAVNIWLLLNLPPTWSHPRYMGLVVVLMLLFNHLAYQFRWPLFGTVALRVPAWNWIVFGSFYIFYSIGRTFFTP